MNAGGASWRWRPPGGPLSLATAMAIATFASLAIAVGMLPWRTELPEAIAPPETTGSEEFLDDQARARARMRCDTCGVIETIRHTEAAGGVPARYEFGVRMEDGSLRLSTGAEAARWQVGDRMMLLGGAR
jgi:hypothetical protein